VGPRYFETLGVRIAEGREFDERDRKGTPGVAIVNESLAARLWPRGGALGSIVVAEGTPLTVIGVVRDVQYRSPAQPPPPFLYASYWQTPTIDDRPIDSRTHVRVEGDPREVLQRVRREIATLDPEVPISEDRPLTEWLVYSFQPLRVAGAVLLTFGGLALLLAAIGLYGLLAYTVGRRTRDIAIRMALGADARRVARSVWRRGAVLASIGAILGLVAVLTSHRVLDRFLVGIPPDDPIALAAATVLLVAVAALASYLPARKASRIDPLVALRTE
jgi:predicted lysophospholipase L1 biosynthesis ABC-type transport system permease subunit